MCSGESKVKSQMFKVEGKLSCEFEQLTLTFGCRFKFFRKSKVGFDFLNFKSCSHQGQPPRRNRGRSTSTYRSLSDWLAGSAGMVRRGGSDVRFGGRICRHSVVAARLRGT